jgi:hypothetical protein
MKLLTFVTLVGVGHLLMASILLDQPLSPPHMSKVHQGLFSKLTLLEIKIAPS